MHDPFGKATCWGGPLDGTELPKSLGPRVALKFFPMLANGRRSRTPALALYAYTNVPRAMYRFTGEQPIAQQGEDEQEAGAAA